MIGTVNLGINFRAHTPPTRAKLLECCLHWRRALRSRVSVSRTTHTYNLMQCQRMLYRMRRDRNRRR